jgi:hypothetical protein
VATRTYALTAPIACDALDVLQAVACGAVAQAVDRYRGPLLPRSQAPGVAQWREHLEVAVREAVLASGDPAHALRYGRQAPYDLAVHEHALRTLPPRDPRRALVAGRLAAGRCD